MIMKGYYFKMVLELRIEDEHFVHKSMRGTCSYKDIQLIEVDTNITLLSCLSVVKFTATFTILLQGMQFVNVQISDHNIYFNLIL